MWIVVASAALLSLKNVIIGKYFIASFLGFISLITANPLWYGVAILKPSKSATKSFYNTRTAFEAMIVLVGAILFTYGIVLEGKGYGTLLMVFGCLGLIGLPKLVKRLMGQAKQEDRIRGHMIGLLTSGISAYTAFFVFGASTWMQQWLSGMWGVFAMGCSRGIGGFGNHVRS